MIFSKMYYCLSHTMISEEYIGRGGGMRGPLVNMSMVETLNSIHGRRIVYNSCIEKCPYIKGRHFDYVSVSLHEKQGEKIKLSMIIILTR